MTTEWIRVSKRFLCPLCEKPDGCMVHADGHAAICIRLESKRPQKLGWWHRLDGKTKPPAPVRPEKVVKIDAEKIWWNLHYENRAEKRDELAENLGVDAYALALIGTVWIPARKAWGFPMYDGQGKIIGIRIRNIEGDKYAWPGSRNGLFLSTMPVDARSPLWVCEGPTSASAALTLGLQVIGRPNCSACDEMVVEYIRLNRVRRVVICADVDENEAGQRGAEKLQKALNVPSVIVFPPTGKDLREFLKSGGTRAELESMLRNFIWSVPNKENCHA